MVNVTALLAEAASKASEETVLERLDPERRAAVVLALVGLGLLGVLMVMVIILGGRWARHSRSRRSSRLSLETALNEQKLKRSPSAELSTGETLADPPGDGETKS